MRLLPPGILLLIFLRVAHADPNSAEDLTLEDLGAAQCDDDQVKQLRNMNEDDPCQVAVKLLGPCNLTPDSSVRSTTCTCNLVFYNIFSACSSVCLDMGILPYPQWTQDCPGKSLNTSDYPFKPQMGVNIPKWANEQLSSGGTFNQAAVFSNTDTGWTAIQKATPVIAVFSVLLIALLCWYIYRHYRRNIYARKAQKSISPFHAGHDRSLSDSSITSTSHLTTSRLSTTSGLHMHRAWIYLGGLFNTVTTVRGKRRNTDWAIDEENAEQQYRLDHRSRDLEPILEHEAVSSPQEETFLSPSTSSDSPPGSPAPKKEPTASMWWHFDWLGKLGFLGGAGNRFTLPKGSDYKSSHVSTLVRSSDFRIESSDCHDAGTGLLQDNDASGSTPIAAASSPNSPWSAPQAPAGRETGPQRTQAVCEATSNSTNLDERVMLISRTPGVNFATSEEQQEPIVRAPTVRIQPPLQPNRLGNVATNDVHDNPSALPDLSSLTTSPNSSSLPYPATMNTFGALTQHAPSPSGRSMLRPSVEQLNDFALPSTTDPTLLFPASVRSAGYTVPPVQANGTRHARNVTEPTLLHSDERSPGGASSLSYITIPSPHDSLLPPPPTALQEQRPPSYSQGPSRSAVEDPVPPYAAARQRPAAQEKRRPRSAIDTRETPTHSSREALSIETTRRDVTHQNLRQLAMEVSSPDLSNLGSDLISTTGEASAGVYSTLASSRLLPSPDGSYPTSQSLRLSIHCRDFKCT